MSDEISLVPALRISSSGLEAESRRMEVIANNVANANTTRGKDGKVFRRKEIVFAEKLADAHKNSGAKKKQDGVAVKGIVDDTRPAKIIYRPGHPDADSEGYVSMPNINPIEEMVDMMSATRAYEANLASIKAAREMAKQALGISK